VLLVLSCWIRGGGGRGPSAAGAHPLPLAEAALRAPVLLLYCQTAPCSFVRPAGVTCAALCSAAAGPAAAGPGVAGHWGVVGLSTGAAPARAGPAAHASRRGVLRSLLFGVCREAELGTRCCILIGSAYGCSGRLLSLQQLQQRYVTVWRMDSTRPPGACWGDLGCASAGPQHLATWRTWALHAAKPSLQDAQLQI
jgi:hypothetical protein